jgi:acid phosphatase (class A)
MSAFAVLAMGLLASAVFAAEKAPKALIVLTPTQVDAHRILPAPPLDGAPAAIADNAEVHRLMAAASAERKAQARWDDDHEDASLFYSTIGGGFDLAKLPATAALIEVVMNDQKIAVSDAKKVFARNRPWVGDKTITTCDPDDKPATSYPSGHAMVGYTLGLVLATLIPEKADAINARAEDYALSRAICGSHYPSDTVASHVLGAEVATELLDSPALQPKIAAAKAELVAAGFTR